MMLLALGGISLLALSVGGKSLRLRRRDKPSPVVEVNLMASVGWDGKFHVWDVRLDGRSLSQREEERPGHHGRPAREGVRDGRGVGRGHHEGRRVHVWQVKRHH